MTAKSYYKKTETKNFSKKKKGTCKTQNFNILLLFSLIAISDENSFILPI